MLFGNDQITIREQTQTAPELTDEQIQREIIKCSSNPVYYLVKWVKIYDATERAWIPFVLWREQESVLMDLNIHKLMIVLKARQLGLTWLVLGWILWMMLFRPIVTALLFSRRDDEAIHLLDERLKGMYKRLPDFLKMNQILVSNDHKFQLQNKSTAMAFPPNAGDSYTATIVLIDEADLIPDLNKLLASVKPTIDGGGWLVMISRSDKRRPSSPFKLIFRAARKQLNDWYPVFLPWWVRPDRNRAWYNKQRRDFETRGELDELFAQYPQSEDEALSPSTKNKKINLEFLKKCFTELPPIKPSGLNLSSANLNHLRIFKLPQPKRHYVIGADPAEGSVTSNDSALEVVDVITGEQVASLADTLEPSQFGAVISVLSYFYNDAKVLVERNNHGHAVMLWLNSFSTVELLNGFDGKPGWLSSSRGKALLYDITPFVYKLTLIHDMDTYLQLASIEDDTLKAPKGDADDRAVAYMLSLKATELAPAGISFYDGFRRKAEIGY